MITFRPLNPSEHHETFLLNLSYVAPLHPNLLPGMAWEPLGTGHMLQLDFEWGGWGRHKPVA